MGGKIGEDSGYLYFDRTKSETYRSDRRCTSQLGKAAITSLSQDTMDVVRARLIA